MEKDNKNRFIDLGNPPLSNPRSPRFFLLLYPSILNCNICFIGNLFLNQSLIWIWIIYRYGYQEIFWFYISLEKSLLFFQFILNVGTRLLTYEIKGRGTKSTSIKSIFFYNASNEIVLEFLLYVKMLGDQISYMKQMFIKSIRPFYWG